MNANIEMTAPAHVSRPAAVTTADKETKRTTLEALALVAFVGVAAAALAYAGLGQVRFAPTVAKELMQASGLRSEAGDHEGAVAAGREAVETYRRLMRKNTIHFVPQLATSLNNLSERLRLGGDHAGALAAIEEAIQIRRQLTKSDPGRYGDSLAQSLQLSERIEATHREQASDFWPKITSSRP